MDTSYAQLVERESVRQTLDGWYAGWTDKPSLAMVHGREGAGKSWAVLDWWRRLENQPLTLLITSNMPFKMSDPQCLLEDALILPGPPHGVKSDRLLDIRASRHGGAVRREPDGR